MQPPADTPRPPPDPRGDEEELYRRHHREFHRAVSRAVRAPREIIEDACQTAWAILLRPSARARRGLRLAARRRGPRGLPALERSTDETRRLERAALQEDGAWQEVMADPRSLDATLEALEALRALASLPERRRSDLALKIAGYSHREIRREHRGRTRTNVNKSLVKARAESGRRNAQPLIARRTGRQKGGPNPALVPLRIR